MIPGNGGVAIDTMEAEQPLSDDGHKPSDDREPSMRDDTQAQGDASPIGGFPVLSLLTWGRRFGKAALGGTWYVQIGGLGQCAAHHGTSKDDK